MKHRIPMERGTYFARKWLVLQDGSDQWLYVAKSGLTYVFVELTDLPAYCGSDAGVQWCAQVASVDLASADLDTQAQALQSCGADVDHLDDCSPEERLLCIAEAMFSYGAKSPLWSDGAGKPRDGASDDSRDFRSLRAAARRVAEDMLDDSTRDDVLDSRIVNAIGQTAREFAQGTSGLWDALRRIRDAGDQATPDQQLILKMYAKCEQTLGAGPVPADIREEQS